MPFSSELGMNVFDPAQAYQSGLSAAQTGFNLARQRREALLDERRMQMMEGEYRAKASALLLQQQGIEELKDYMTDGKMSFRDALFKVAPKLYASNPQALATMAHQEATEKATETYRASMLQKAQEAARATAEYRQLQLNKPSAAAQEAMDMAQMEAGMAPGRTPQLLQPRPSGEQIPGMPSEATQTPSPPTALPASDIQKRALEIMRSKTDKDTTSQKERDDFVKLTKTQKSLAALVQSNPDDVRLREMLADANAGLEAFHLQHKGGLTATLQYDDQGRPIINLGEGKATVGTQTAVQTELANIRNSVVQIDQARNVLTEKDLGVPGGFWNTIVNRWVAQVVPEAADPRVSSNRAQLQKAVDSYLQNQQSRGRLSAAERADVRKTLITQGLGESLRTAQAVLDTMAKIQKFEAISRAKVGQQPLQDWMFNNLTQTDIRQLYREGSITQPEFFQWASKAKAK